MLEKLSYECVTIMRNSLYRFILFFYIFVSSLLNAEIVTGKCVGVTDEYLAGISLAQQIVVMCLDMVRGAAQNDDDEWVEWLLLNLSTGASGLGVLQSIPLVGEAVQKMTGGYVKTGSLGQMVYDFEGGLTHNGNLRN